MMPGPGSYDAGPKFGAVNNKFFIAKGKNVNFYEDIVKRAKKTPGVGEYQFKKKERIAGFYSGGKAGGSFVDNAIY